MKAIKLFTILFAAVLLAGCGNAPEACFVPSHSIAEKGEEIIFDECSLFGDTWSWDFGDGTTSELPDPRHTFTSVGEFLVLLTYSKGGTRSDTHSEIVLVGNRTLSFITVNNLPVNNSLGNPWDGAGDAADPILKMKPSSSGSWSLSTPINTNMTMSLPFIWDLTANAFGYTYDSWDFVVLDDDGVTADTMGTWTIDLNTVYPDRFIPLTGTNTDIEVHYTVN